jgi:hypothetical protein
MQNVSLLVDYFITLIWFALNIVVLLERALISNSKCFVSVHLMAAHYCHVSSQWIVGSWICFCVGGEFIHQFARNGFTSFVLVSCCLQTFTHHFFFFRNRVFMFYVRYTKTPNYWSSKIIIKTFQNIKIK